MAGRSLLLLSVLAATAAIVLVTGNLQGVGAEQLEFPGLQDAPTESQCRPYIEKALKQLGTGEHVPGAEQDESPESKATAETDEQISTDELHLTGDTSAGQESLELGSRDIGESAEESSKDATNDIDSLEYDASLERHVSKSQETLEAESLETQEDAASFEDITEERDTSHENEAGAVTDTEELAPSTEDTGASTEEAAASPEEDVLREGTPLSAEDTSYTEDVVSVTEEITSSTEDVTESAEREAAAISVEEIGSSTEQVSSTEEESTITEEVPVSIEATGEAVADSVEDTVTSTDEDGHISEETAASTEEEAPISEAAASVEEEILSDEAAIAISTEEIHSTEDETGGPEEVAHDIEDTAASTEEGTPSVEEAITSAEEGTPSTEEAIAIAEEGTPSTEEAIASAEEGTPSDEEAVADEVLISTEEETQTETEPISTDDGASITEGEHVRKEEIQSIAEEAIASVEETASEAEEAIASVEEAASEAEEAIASVEEAASDVEEPTASIEEIAPSAEESIVSTEEGSAEREAPTLEEVKASTEEGILSAEEITAHAEEEIPPEEAAAIIEEEEISSAGDAVPEEESTPEEELTYEGIIPDNLRPREHIAQILKLDLESAEHELLLGKTIDVTLKELKRLYDNAIKPLEVLYKYRDLSNRHFGDPEIFSKPLILFMGPWSGGKSSIINYLLDNEYKHTALRTGAEPSPAYFNILMWGGREEVLDGTQLAADWTFSGLQKFGQGLLDRLRGLRLPNTLLEKVNIVEIPGILEIRKQVERLFPFNDACQWFIDRADIIFLVYDPAKLDVGPETEAILDQLKGREYQTRIILNKADQVRPEELMRVQGTLIWNISPLMSSSEPPVMYSTSLWSMPYEAGAPIRLLQAQERAFLRDMRNAIDKRVENKIASARRFAVRVRNHAKMVDCYLTTYYNHKGFFGNRKKVSDDIIERPQDYHIYEGLSTLTNISRYDLPDPDVYRDFFRLNPLYDFQQLSATCTYFRGCPINRLDVAIAYDLPELVGKYKKAVDETLASQQPSKS